MVIEQAELGHHRGGSHKWRLRLTVLKRWVLYANDVTSNAFLARCANARPPSTPNASSFAMQHDQAFSITVTEQR
jgi:hypothetical protein